jgi:hypothetical protein
MRSQTFLRDIWWTDGTARCASAPELLRPPIVAQLETTGDVGVEAPPAVNDRVIDRLQGGEPVANLGHVRPRLSGVVIHARKYPHPAVSPGPSHGGVGAPAPVRPVRNDRAVMRPWSAPSPASLWGKQPLAPLRRRDLEPSFGGRPQDLVLHGQLPDLALGLLERPIIGGPVELPGPPGSRVFLGGPGHRGLPIRLVSSSSSQASDSMTTFRGCYQVRLVDMVSVRSSSNCWSGPAGPDSATRVASSWAVKATPKNSAIPVRLAHSKRAMTPVSGP